MTKITSQGVRSIERKIQMYTRTINVAVCAIVGYTLTAGNLVVAATAAATAAAAAYDLERLPYARETSHWHGHPGGTNSKSHLASLSWNIVTGELTTTMKPRAYGGMFYPLLENRCLCKRADADTLTAAAKGYPLTSSRLLNDHDVTRLEIGTTTLGEKMYEINEWVLGETSECCPVI